jgi:large subunit ribosomal protein L13
VNAGAVKFTGRKLEQKTYYRHTGFPGGVKARTAGGILGGAHPERVLMKAVERMLPKESPLARRQLTHLRVYAGGEHPHEAQNPEVIDFAARNPKNVRSQ